MALSDNLISQFVKATKDKDASKKESTVYGTAVEYNGSMYVRIDGSDHLTPVSSTTNIKEGERVTVMIKNHTATVTGNMSSPSARVVDLKEGMDEVADEISEFEILVSYKISTDELKAVQACIEKLLVESAEIKNAEILIAEIEKLSAKYADLEHVSAKDVEALNAEIENLRATFGNFTDISTETLTAVNAELDNLKAYNAEFTYVSADVLSALKADIKELDVKYAEIENLDTKYANIDFANISEAAIEKLFSESGIIKDLIVSEGHITGELVGVTIKGDLIEGGTVKADKLVVKGSDGLYYKLNVEAGAVASTEVSEEELQNGLHGTAIIAKTITAEKIAVDDLVAFGATIGGFHITTESLYSGVKESVGNGTRGTYLDKEGQFAVGDSSNFLRYYKDDDGSYKLEISAASLVFSASGKTIEEVIEDGLNIEIGARNLIRNSTTLMFKDYGFHSTVYAVNADIENDVLVLTAYPTSTSTFTAEIVDDVLIVAEQNETETTVNAKVVSDILSVN